MSDAGVPGLRHRPVEPRGTGPPPRRGAARPGHALHLAAALLIVAGLIAIVHGPVLRAQALAFDDNEYVTRNPLVTNPGPASVGRFFGEVLRPSSVRGYYHPLAMTSLMVDHARGPGTGDLRVYHETNLALHIVNALLIVLVMRALFGALVPAALAGLVFGLHPMTVEPVAWISERKTLLASSFALACVLCYLEYCRRRARPWFYGALGLNVLALLSKPTVMPLPLLLLVLDAWPLRRLGVRTVVEKWPFMLLAVVGGVITLISQQRTTLIEQTDLRLWPLRAAYLLGFYLEKIVWPVDLTSVYPLPVPFTLENPAVGLRVAGACALTILAILAARRVPGPLAGWVFFVIAVAPTLGIVSYSWLTACDRYAYFPALGILMALTAAWAGIWRAGPGSAPARRLLALLPVGVVLTLEAVGVREALRPWSDSFTLHRHMERRAPESPTVHAQLGVLLGQAGARDDAIAHLRRALALESRYPDAHYNLGIVLAAGGRLEEATRHFLEADAMLPDDPSTLYNLGVTLRIAGRPDEAAERFRRVLEIEPDHPGAANELGGVRMVQGRFAEAVEHFRRALARQPASGRLHYHLAAALLRRGGDAAAVRDHLRQAMAREPGWATPVNDLAWILATSADSTMRDPVEALRLAELAVTLTDGRQPSVLDTRAAAEAAVGRFDAAVRTGQEAIDVARRAGQDTLVADLRRRQALYRRRVAYVQPVPGGGGR